ncbi:MAG: ATP-dependent RecD-like DNA helicase [Thermodesulfobacteriota bacterium]
MAGSAGNTRSERLEVLEGVLDRLVYTAEAGDFVVARLVVRGRREPVTIVGSLPSPHAGETLTLRGRWEFDKKFGEQFRFAEVSVSTPSTVKGMEKYLASNLVKGIGPEMASRIVAAFGERTLDVIEKHPEELLKVSGIGQVRAHKISEAFREQKDIRGVMLFLQTHGVSPTYAFKIFRRYGKEAVEAVSNNPYCLATDIRGIGFRSADRIAGSLGIDARSPLRCQAGVLHILEEVQGEGHVYLPRGKLVERSRELLGASDQLVERAIEELAARRDIVVEDDRVYPSNMHYKENSVAQRLRDLMTAPRLFPPIRVDAAIKWIEGRIGITLSTGQKIAIEKATEYKVLIVTGGPGTGKTTLLRSLIEILEAKKLAIVLAAPTGRAAKRVAEATGREAKTIHRLLEYAPGSGGFQRNASRPLDADVVVVDEASMVDLSLMHNLLSAIPLHGTVLLVGDSDQLPSVGPGDVLADLIRCGKIPIVRLDRVFRQAQNSLIVTNAHLVNSGNMPIDPPEGNTASDFYWIQKEDPGEILRLVKEVVASRIPERFGFNPIEEIQILSPMRKGTLGTENLNREVRQLLNPSGAPIRGDRFRVGDRVMQTRNNYDKDVFNGDVGKIVSYDPEWDEAVVEIDGRPVTYHISEMDELTLAYAVTVHKAQGSEYNAVVIPLSTQHYVLLRRKLLYTAMTRGKQLVVLVGSARALKLAVDNATEEPRYSALAAKV